MKRIAFCGASGTGKTTLAAWVAETAHLVGDGCAVPLNPVGSRSTARAMGLDNPYDVDKKGLRVEFQTRLQAEKISWELAHTAFVTDRTVLDELAYTLMHIEVDAIPDGYVKTALEHMSWYTRVVFCPIDAFWQVGTDPARIANLAYHRVFEQLLHGMLKVYCPSFITLSQSDLDVRKFRLLDLL